LLLIDSKIRAAIGNRLLDISLQSSILCRTEPYRPTKR
jgi:hypothetical protein